MAVAQPAPGAGRYAFWATGITLYALWTLGTLAGALIGRGIDTSALGLDAAAPAIFLALLWPQLCRDRGRAVAAGAAVVALGLVQPSRPRPRHDHRACPERHPASASRSPERW